MSYYKRQLEKDIALLVKVSDMSPKEWYQEYGERYNVAYEFAASGQVGHCHALATNINWYLEKLGIISGQSDTE